MNNNEDFEINYWAGGNDFSLQLNKDARSVKKKLFIVFSFVGILATIPVLIYGLSYLQDAGTQKITIKSVEPVKEIVPIQTESPKITETKVLNNDSYWKISKRHCGTGKFYLSIRDQNAGKPLYKGDFVEVACSL